VPNSVLGFFSYQRGSTSIEAKRDNGLRFLPFYDQSIKDTLTQVHDLNARGKDICKIMIHEMHMNGFADEFKYIIDTNEKLNNCLIEEIMHLKKTTN
jgi:hypothetical protein